MRYELNVHKVQPHERVVDTEVKGGEVHVTIEDVFDQYDMWIHGYNDDGNLLLPVTAAVRGAISLRKDGLTVNVDSLRVINVDMDVGDSNVADVDLLRDVPAKEARTIFTENADDRPRDFDAL